MTATAPGYNPDQLRYWRAFQTPLVFPTTQQAMMVLGKVYEEFPAYREEMDKIGVVWLLPAAARRVLPERPFTGLHQRRRAARQEDPQLRRRHSEGVHAPSARCR